MEMNENFAQFGPRMYCISTEKHLTANKDMLSFGTVGEERFIIPFSAKELINLLQLMINVEDSKNVSPLLEIK